MPPNDNTRFVHVVASVNMTDGTGSIHYVNPSNVQSNAGPAAGMAAQDVSLVLLDGLGQEIGRIYPELRLEACSSHDDNRPTIGLIQQDLVMDERLTAIVLMKNDTPLDRFESTPSLAPEPTAGLELVAPEADAGAGHRLGLGSAGVAPQKGVTYMIQVKPDDETMWQTLSIGREKPEFVIDKNQFPGATKVDVRVIQVAGFKRTTVDERVVSLD